MVSTSKLRQLAGKSTILIHILRDGRFSLGIGLYSYSKTYFLRRRLELSTESVADKDSTESTADNSWDSQSPEQRPRAGEGPRAGATSAVLAILLELLWLPSRSIFHACVEASLSTSCT